MELWRLGVVFILGFALGSLYVRKYPGGICITRAHKFTTNCDRDR